MYTDEANLSGSNVIQVLYLANKEGGKGASRSRLTDNTTVLSQFTKNKIGISRFTEKKRTFFFKQKLHDIYTVTF